jgi:hypothetical protein
MLQQHLPSWVTMNRLAWVIAACALVIFGTARRAPAVIDIPGETLAKHCALAEAITVLRVEKVNREKKGIVYRKVRDLKGSFFASRPIFGHTFTHVLRQNPNPDWHRQDVDNQDLQNEAILAWAREGKIAVVFQRGAEQAVCLGHAWYCARGQPPAKEHWVLAAGADSRFLRLFCGDVEELVAAVTDILGGKMVTVPRMVGTVKMVSDRTGPVRGIRADKPEPQREVYNPFHWQAGPCGTHRGNPQRTGTDNGSGPKAPEVLWTYQSRDHFIASLVPGTKELFASSLGAFNSPGMHALACDLAETKRERWSRFKPMLDQPVVAAPALCSAHTDLLIFGDGMHQSERASLCCLRARDGFPLWRLPVRGKLVHFEGTPTVAGTPQILLGELSWAVVARECCPWTHFGLRLKGRISTCRGLACYGTSAQQLHSKYPVDVKKDSMFTTDLPSANCAGGCSARSSKRNLTINVSIVKTGNAPCILPLVNRRHPFGRRWIRHDDTENALRRTRPDTPARRILLREDWTYEFTTPCKTNVCDGSVILALWTIR